MAIDKPGKHPPAAHIPLSDTANAEPFFAVVHGQDLATANQQLAQPMVFGCEDVRVSQ